MVMAHLGLSLYARTNLPLLLNAIFYCLSEPHAHEIKSSWIGHLFLLCLAIISENFKINMKESEALVL